MQFRAEDKYHTFLDKLDALYEVAITELAALVADKVALDRMMQRAIDYKCQLPNNFDLTAGNADNTIKVLSYEYDEITSVKSDVLEQMAVIRKACCMVGKLVELVPDTDYTLYCVRGESFDFTIFCDDTDLDIPTDNY